MNALRKLSAATFGTALIGLLIGELALPKIASAQNARLRPVLEGVMGGSIACFGYLNENAGSITVPVGDFNKFTPPPEQRTQPTTFVPNRVRGGTMVNFPAGTRLVWTLGNPASGRRSTATASSSSKAITACPPEEPTPTPTP